MGPEGIYYHANSSGNPVATSVKVFTVDRNGNTTSVEERGWLPYSTSLWDPCQRRSYKKNRKHVSERRRRFSQRRNGRYKSLFFCFSQSGCDSAQFAGFYGDPRRQRRCEIPQPV